MLSNKLDKIMDKISEYAKYIYVVHILLAFCALTTDTIITSITMPLTLVLCGMVLLYRMLHVKKYIKYPFLWMYIVFVFMYIVTAVLNLEYGYMSNLKIIVWMVLLFGTLYLCDVGKEKNQVKKELHHLLAIIIGGTTLMNVAGLVMAFMGYCVERETPGRFDYLIGLVPWGRLYGVHTDPNYGATLTFVAILAAVFLFMRNQNRKIRVILVISIIVDMMHLSFSGSRTGLVSLAAGLAVFTFIHMLQKKKKVIQAMVLSVVCVGVIFVANSLLASGFNTAMEIISEYRIEHGLVDSDYVQVLLGREEELSGDISNRRFDLWINALKVTKTAPVMGISFGNIVSYCEEVLPESYLLTNDYTVFDAFHNMFMDLLASQGLVGTVWFLIIIITSLWFLLRNRNRLEDDDKFISCFLFSAAVGMVCSSLFVSEILYVHNQITVIFWLIWGFLFYFYDVNHEKEDKVE